MKKEKLEVVKASVVNLEVEAIVNAANSGLLRGGGVCGAIFDQAGFELDRECNAIGRCETGEAVITKGYNLKAKYIIHTVAPRWYDFYEKNKEELLRNCYKNSLELAKQKGIKTIAFPCVGTGIYQCPLELGCEYAMEEAIKQQKYFDKIVFACFREEEYAVYQEKLKNFIN